MNGIFTDKKGKDIKIGDRVLIDGKLCIVLFDDTVKLTRAFISDSLFYGANKDERDYKNYGKYYELANTKNNTPNDIELI